MHGKCICQPKTIVNCDNCCLDLHQILFFQRKSWTYFHNNAASYVVSIPEQIFNVWKCQLNYFLSLQTCILLTQSYAFFSHFFSLVHLMLNFVMESILVCLLILEYIYIHNWMPSHSLPVYVCLFFILSQQISFCRFDFAMRYHYNVVQTCMIGSTHVYAWHIYIWCVWMCVCRSRYYHLCTRSTFCTCINADRKHFSDYCQLYFFVCLLVYMDFSPISTVMSNV